MSNFIQTFSDCQAAINEILMSEWIFFDNKIYFWNQYLYFYQFFIQFFTFN